MARWGSDPWSGGSWSYLRPGGSPIDRAALGAPFGRIVLAGEATNPDQPAMVHGAFDDGERAAHDVLGMPTGPKRTLVIGAGAAGIGAARALCSAGRDVVVVEARDRIGGRVHTVGLGDVVADAGAAWLQQGARNRLLPFADAAGFVTVPTDFGAPLTGVAPGLARSIRASAGPFSRSVEQMSIELPGRIADWCVSHGDGALSDVLASVLAAADATTRRAAAAAVAADVVLETGAEPAALSARWSFAEPGVGHGDRWLPDGIGALLAVLASGLAVRFGHEVDEVRDDGESVTVSGPGWELRADACICTVPVGLIAAGRPALRPGLPTAHASALARIGTGVVEKVLLRFDRRWWPIVPGGYMRWHTEPPGWGEWADLTDGCGAPVVAGFAAGDAVTRLHAGRSDLEVAIAATRAFEGWAAAAAAR